jgi:hypothetical protein
MFKLQEKTSALKKEHPALPKMKFITFFCYVCGSFLPSWIRIRIANLDADPIRIRSTACNTMNLVPVKRHHLKSILPENVAVKGPRKQKGNTFRSSPAKPNKPLMDMRGVS